MVPFDVVTGRDDMVSQGGSVTTLCDHVISTGHNIKWDHFDILTTGKSDLQEGLDGGDTNVSCQLKFWPFVSSQLNFGAFVSCHLIGC